MSYSKLFDEILSKPSMYVGNSSIVKIKAFMDGYIYANLENEKRNYEDLYFGFQPWVISRFELGVSKDWASIITFMSTGEDNAFEMTKALWKEYKSEHKSKI